MHMDFISNMPKWCAARQLVYFQQPICGPTGGELPLFLEDWNAVAFNEVVKPAPYRMKSLIRVLAGIAETQSSFDAMGELQPDGSYKITSPAEITASSDNIVVSYPRLLGDPADSDTSQHDEHSLAKRAEL